MKKLYVTIFLTTCTLVLRAQNVEIPKDEKGNAYYSSIVEVQELKAKELFIKSNEWIAQNFKSANDVIQFKDEETGKIIGKGNVSTHYKYLGVISDPVYADFTIEIAVKDGRYRCIISNIYVKDCGDLAREKPITNIPQKVWLQIVSGHNDNIKQLLISLEEYMKKPKRDENW